MKKRDLKMLALLGLASGLLLANQVELNATKNDVPMEQEFLSSLSQENQELFRSLDQSGQLLAKLIASPSVGDSDANNWNNRFGAGFGSDGGGNGHDGENLLGGSGNGGGYGNGYDDYNGSSNSGYDNGYSGSCGNKSGCGNKGSKGDSGAKGVGGAKGPGNQGKSNPGKSNASSKNNAKPGQVSLGETPSSGWGQERSQVTNRAGNNQGKNNQGKNNQGKNANSTNNGHVSLNDTPTSRGNAGKQGFNAGRPISNSTAGANQGNQGNSGRAGDSNSGKTPGWRSNTPSGQVSFGEEQDTAPQGKFRPAVNRGYTAEEGNAANASKKNAVGNTAKENADKHAGKNNNKGNAKGNAGKANSTKNNSKSNKGNLSFNTEEQPAHSVIDRDLLVSLLNKPTRAQFLRLSDEGQNLALELANQTCKNQNGCDGKNSCQTDANDCAGKGERGHSPGPFTDKNLAVRVAAMHDKRATAGN